MINLDKEEWYSRKASQSDGHLNNIILNILDTFKEAEPFDEYSNSVPTSSISEGSPKH